MGESVFACMHAAVIAPLYILIGDVFFSLTSIAKEVTPHISKLLSEDKQ